MVIFSDRHFELFDLHLTFETISGSPFLGRHFDVLDLPLTFETVPGSPFLGRHFDFLDLPLTFETVPWSPFLGRHFDFLDFLNSFTLRSSLSGSEFGPFSFFPQFYVRRLLICFVFFISIHFW